MEKKKRTEETLPSQYKVILSIKNCMETQNLSVADVKQKVAEKTDIELSDSVLYRLAAENSETEDSFNYDKTLRPIIDALEIDVAGSSLEALQAELELYRNTLRYKKEKIEALEKQVDYLQNEHREKILDIKEEHLRRCGKCQAHQASMQEQLTTKDRRMDEQAARFDRLLARNEYLEDQLLELAKALAKAQTQAQPCVESE